MPQENSYGSIFPSPCKNLRGLKGLSSIVNGNSSDDSFGEEIISDYELAQRKAEESASRRYQAVQWLRQMDNGASAVLSKEPSEEELCLSLRNGLILCNVLNKVNPGAVHKVVENPILDILSNEAGAQSAIQYFENMRNFLLAVGNMKLLTFEASDLEKGGSSSKVVDCILCLKGYYEWKQAGGTGVWRYGGTVRIVSFPKGSPSAFVGSESTDESVDESESSQYEQLLEFLHLSDEVAAEESNAANALNILFDGFALGILKAYLSETNGFEDVPLNSMVIDAILRKIVKDLSAQIVSQGIKFGQHLKKMLKGSAPLSKSEFLEAISKYICQKTRLLPNDIAKYCICGGKREAIMQNSTHSVDNMEKLYSQDRQLEELKLRFQQTKQEIELVNSSWMEEFKRLEHHIKGLETTSSSYHQVLEENRLLYNQIQDLKGTIRVYCRVRPSLPGQNDGQSTVDYIGENGNLMVVNPQKQGKDARKMFNFNKVFGTNVTQEQIYKDTQPLIRSVLDGFNVCIFAYGQTGSGKTYTMSGPDLMTEDTWGVNYRALRDLFQISKKRGDVIQYEVGVQMIEIYNEQVRDLLVIDGSNRRLEIRNNSQLNGLNVPDACLVPVKCTGDVLELMKIGHRNRAVGATALNERSSRSHSILTVHVRGKELMSGTILRGCLHLVDLAGSERVDKSEAVGERLKEAQHINRSLSALGDVISALAQKSTHIPYRNSKLTQVLQDSLGGHAKTLMFVHINHGVNAFGETISTLKFAERVASIELGAARSNKESGEIREIKEEVSNLKLALERKEAELLQLKSAPNRCTIDPPKIRTGSPFHMPRQGNNATLKPEISQPAVDDSKSSEVRSSSSGKQRKYRLPSKFTDRDNLRKVPFITEEKKLLVVSSKTRSPSPPPLRRSMSTDRGSVMRSAVKPDPVENQPLPRRPFPIGVSCNKTIVSLPFTHSTEKNASRQDNISDAYLNLQRTSVKKFQQEHEDEQAKQALSIRNAGFRTNKLENKGKAKNQLPTSTTLIYDTEGGGKIEETENENILAGAPPVYSVLKVKKLPRNSSRNNSQNVGPREPAKEGVPEIKRSRSTPRGKLLA
ncbi:kinesin-like protein KIN-14F [Impatiens glandulifera]|uniref:kinesin-like protein KIN-14F n=1 Tax=Impatiens glandulifera TaxID=253017 RepID=UPI001FB18E90|nr:kinesin-like protein KIN-14F [Impatiens glandulifera]XP_047340983.1 kinesin-like protein KIN-14F [Impatiens glandulifera]